MRTIFISLVLGIYFVSSAQINYCDSEWVNDTIYFNSRRLMLTLPEKSIERATEYIFKGEGKGICYPLRLSFNNDGACRMEMLMIDQIVNTTYDRLISNHDFDIELWNTFNLDHKGSRSFMTSGLYSRIDVLTSGIVVYYENLSQDMAEIANQIMKSIRTKENESLDTTINRRRRRTRIVE